MSKQQKPVGPTTRRPSTEVLLERSPAAITAMTARNDPTTASAEAIKLVTAVKESAMRTPTIPTLARMIQNGRASAAKIKRASQEALIEWLAQSERLNIARTHYHLRGARFIDFAKRIGVDRSSAFELVKLYKHRAAIMSRCLDMAEQAAARDEQFDYPGWRTALEWYAVPSRRITNPY